MSIHVTPSVSTVALHNTYTALEEAYRRYISGMPTLPVIGCDYGICEYAATCEVVYPSEERRAMCLTHAWVTYQRSPRAKVEWFDRGR